MKLATLFFVYAFTIASVAASPQKVVYSKRTSGICTSGSAIETKEEWVICTPY